MQYLPDWLYGFVPPDWWPNRPRETFFTSISALPVNAGTTVTTEIVFPKRVDALVFGGTLLVTTTNEVTVLCPLSGLWSEKLIRLRNPAGNIVYTQSFNRSTPDTGFVPAENLFAVWQSPAQRPVFWPMPIPVPRGGSLQMDVQDVGGVQNHNCRFTLYCALMYDESQREAA